MVLREEGHRKVEQLDLKRILATPVELPEVKRPGELTIEQRIKKLSEKIIEPREGVSVDEETRVRTVLKLIESCEGAITQRLDDLELLAEIDIRFEPIVEVGGPQTAGKVRDILGISHEKMIELLSNPQLVKEWNAHRVRGKSKYGYVWQIPAETVNRLNIKEKTTLTVAQIHEALMNGGLELRYGLFYQVADRPRDFFDLSREGLSQELFPDEETLLEEGINGIRNRVSLRDGITLIKKLLEWNRIFNEWDTTTDIANKRGMRRETVAKYARRGKIGGILIPVIGEGSPEWRFNPKTEEEQVIEEIKRLWAEMPDEMVMVEFPRWISEEAQERIERYLREKYGSLEAAKKHGQRELGRLNISIFRDTPENFRSRTAIRVLMQRYGSIRAIQDSISEEGLNELGLEIIENGTRIRPIKKPRGH